MFQIFKLWRKFFKLEPYDSSTWCGGHAFSLLSMTTSMSFVGVKYEDKHQFTRGVQDFIMVPNFAYNHE